MPETHVAAVAEAGTTPLSLKSRLSAMMFLQYFAQGCYLPIASVYLQDALDFDSRQIGTFNSALAVGPLLAPFVIGQLVDRHLATQYVLAFCHLLAGLLMFGLYTQTSYAPVMALGILYSVLYVPTMMLTNSLSFHHLSNQAREFPLIRFWGTAGFVVPAWLIELVLLQGLVGDRLNAARGVAFGLSGAASLVMALYALTLPHTPPQRRESRRFAPAAVVGMLRYRHFLVLVGVSFAIAIVHNFYFVWNGPFLTTLLRYGGVEGAYEQRIASLGQISELAVMAGLGLAIVKLGFRGTLLVGAFAYLARCLAFALAAWLPASFAVKMALAGGGQALHGLCFGCFLATAYIYVDRVAPSDIRGSMQNLYGTFVLGLGFFCGGLVAAEVGEYFSATIDGVTVRNWTSIWLSCAVLAAICLAALATWFPRTLPPTAVSD
jgi:nucleoside transporter